MRLRKAEIRSGGQSKILGYYGNRKISEINSISEIDDLLDQTIEQVDDRFFDINNIKYFTYLFTGTGIPLHGVTNLVRLDNEFKASWEPIYNKGAEIENNVYNNFEHEIDAIDRLTAIMINQDLRPPLKGVPYSPAISSSEFIVDQLARETGRHVPFELYPQNNNILLGNNAINSLSPKVKNHASRNEMQATLREYFEANNYSQVSHDCINYLGNQMFENKSFEVNQDWYKSATPPKRNSPSEPLLALEWTPGSAARAVGFTNFGHVLHDFFKANISGSYHGAIVRDMMRVNTVPYPSDMKAVEFDKIFRFAKPNGDKVRIEYKDEFTKEAMRVLSDGGKVDFKDRIIQEREVGPCVDNIIKSLQQADPQNQLIPDANPGPHISKFILDMFNRNKNYGIRFSIGLLGSNTDGHQKNGRTRFNQATNNFDITVDQSLAERGTQLFIRKTLIHESMHAFIKFTFTNPRSGADLINDVNALYQIYRTDNTSATAENLAHHEFISQFVEALANSLAIADNRQHSIEYYKMLSWGGLETSSAYKSLPQKEKDEIQEAIQNERFGRKKAKGKRCP